MQGSKYRIIGLVGQGQFGKVYCASDRKTGQLVALKELSHQRSPTNQFLQELWFIISLQHPNIAACRALEHIETGRYLVMDYCEGGTLRNLLNHDHPLRLLEGLQLIIKVLEGLDYAHNRGIIHCDIKPENILLTLKSQGWHPKLSDFGIARRLPENLKTISSQKPLSFTGGSPAYMAPERFYGLYSRKSDIYAVGIVLYELLIGDRPFHGMPSELMWAQMNQRLQLPTYVPEALQTVLRKALEKIPARRFTTALDMATALQIAIADPAVQKVSHQIIPWGKDPESERTNSASVPINLAENIKFNAIPLFEGKPTLNPIVASTNSSFFYTAFDKNLTVWNPSLKQSIPTETLPNKIQKPYQVLTLPEPIVNLFPLESGCCILTSNHIYRWEHSNQLECLFSLEHLNSLQQLQSKPKLTDVSSSAPQTAFSCAIDPKGHYLAVAHAGQLRFYSLLQTPQNQDKKAEIRSTIVELNRAKLPKLLFLDQRHLLASWSNLNSAQPASLLKIYTRRGTEVGTLKLSVNLAQLLPTPKTYTLLGITSHTQPTALLIHLKPFSIIRIPLENQPICACATPWGYGLVDQQKKMIILNQEGNQVGNYTVSILPHLIAPWGETGLVLVTSKAGLYIAEEMITHHNPEKNL